MAASHVLRKWDLVLFQINTRGGRKETTPSPFIPTMLRSRDSALRYFQPHQMSFISFNVSGIAMNISFSPRPSANTSFKHLKLEGFIEILIEDSGKMR